MSGILTTPGNTNDPDYVYPAGTSAPLFAAGAGDGLVVVQLIRQYNSFAGTMQAVNFAGDGSLVSNVTASALLPGVTLSNTTATGNTAINGNLVMNGNIVMNGLFNANSHPLLLKGPGDTNHGIGVSSSITNFTAFNPPDGPIVWGYGGGALGFTSPTNGLALSWNSTSVTIPANLSLSAGQLISTGSNAGIYFNDRLGVANYGLWSCYAKNGRAYFWNSKVGDLMSIDSSGNVRSAGSYFANTSPDLAETIPAAANVEAGDIVCADPQRPESVIRCDRDSQGVLGVISDGTSGFIINAYGKSAGAPLTGQPLVLAGRVPVKVSVENGPIKIGDSLAPSSTPGVAMRADGTGAVIGVALAPFDAEHQQSWGQTGKVLCFVKVGDSSSASKIKRLEEQNQDLAGRLQSLEKLVQSLQGQQSSRSTP